MRAGIVKYCARSDAGCDLVSLEKQPPCTYCVMNACGGPSGLWGLMAKLAVELERYFTKIVRSKMEEGVLEKSSDPRSRLDCET